MSAIPRNEGEDFQEYKLRRAEDHATTKQARKPKLFHDSYLDGTYTNMERNAYKAEKESFPSFRQFKKANKKGGK